LGGDVVFGEVVEGFVDLAAREVHEAGQDWAAGDRGRRLGDE